MELVAKLLCKLGVHKFHRVPMIANLSTYWMQGGQQCVHCGYKRIGFDQAAALIVTAYKRGITDAKTKERKV